MLLKPLDLFLVKTFSTAGGIINILIYNNLRLKLNTIAFVFHLEKNC